jgi:hypothetical protein
MAAGAGRPPEDAWVAAIHGSRADFCPLGAGLVLDERRVLTCAHVICGADGELRPALWVAFPKGDDPYARVAVSGVRVAPQRVADLVVLTLAEPVPPGVVAAPLRCPKPGDLLDRSWWAFGFAGGQPLGNSAEGRVGAALAYGWVRLDAESRYHVAPGFSGGGLWSADYGAVVGIVGAANDRGDGQALTLYEADRCLPGEGIRLLAEWTVQAAGEVALSAWGWSLAEDVEAGRHWRPRSRGVSVDSERGHRFRGRRAALTQIVAWLDRERPDRKVLVVTGSPGVGKSAVLGRVVTTADATIAAALPPDDDAVRARVGSVACAVHAKGKTALDVAMEIARAASAPLPERLEDFAPGLREALTERGGRRFNVIIDALDEATNPAEARSIVTRVAVPIVETCAGVGAQVVLGTRRRDDAGDLLRPFGAARADIDLDAPAYFAVEDLAAYALATLQLRGDERPGNPYADEEVARPVAGRIAALAEGNFLVAGLVARNHGLHDEVAADPAGIAFTATVADTLDDYLERIPAIGDTPVAEVLTALAFAESPGLTAELWQVAVQALTGRALAADQLARFARGSAANFLVQSAGEGGQGSYRLFHQALSDSLVAARGEAADAVADERALTRAFLAWPRRGDAAAGHTPFLASGARAGWDAAPVYLTRSLPGHADRAGLVDELLADDEYLLHADLRRLTPAAEHATTPAGRRRARLLRLTPRAIPAEPADRAALFSVTEALEGLGSTYRDRASPLPYRARWAAVAPRVERAVLEGHTGGVNALCPLQLDGRRLLASAGDDGTVRIWDPATGEEHRTLTGHTRWVTALCPLQLHGRRLLASAGNDTTVRIWDPATGEEHRTLTGHTGWVRALCPLQIDGRRLLASAGADGTVRIWDPATGQEHRTLTGHTGRVNALCPLQ